MKKYIVYDKQSGKIVRSGLCSDNSYSSQASENESIMQGTADDATQKVETHVDGMIIYRVIVDKSPDEMPALKSKKIIPLEKKQANITNEQWQAVLNRLAILESEV